MRTSGAFWAAILVAHAACVQIPRDRILVADIAPELPFRALGASASQVIGWTPYPGVQRVLTTRELLRVAAVQSGSVREEGLHDVCVERATAALDAKMIREALSHMPELRDVDIEIVDFSRVRVPDGRLQFSVANLPRPRGGRCDFPVIWRGHMRYDEVHSMPVWASIRLAQTATVVRAVHEIAAGSSITAADVERVPIREFPDFGRNQVCSVNEALGKRAMKTIRTGDILDARSLRNPPLIAPGQTVRMTVESGPVRLNVEREALSGGELGQAILLRDQTTGKVIRAVTSGPGTAVIRLPGLDHS